MRIIKALEADESPNLHSVSAKELNASEHVQVVMVTLQPGESLKLHITPVGESVPFSGSQDPTSHSRDQDLVR